MPSDQVFCNLSPLFSQRYSGIRSVIDKSFFYELADHFRHGTSCNVLFVDGHVYAVPGRSSPAIYAHKLISTENADDFEKKLFETAK